MTRRRKRKPVDLPAVAATPARGLPALRRAPVVPPVPPAAAGRPAWSSIFAGYRSAFGVSG